VTLLAADQDTRHQSIGFPGLLRAADGSRTRDLRLGKPFTPAMTGTRPWSLFRTPWTPRWPSPLRLRGPTVAAAAGATVSWTVLRSHRARRCRGSVACYDADTSAGRLRAGSQARRRPSRRVPRAPRRDTRSGLAPAMV